MITRGTVVGRVIGLYRYPIKSMQGEALSTAEVGEWGILGDRSFGLIDRAQGSLLSAKLVPELLNAQAFATDDGNANLLLPSGDVLRTDDPDIDEQLSRWLERDVAVVRPEPGATRVIDMEVLRTDAHGALTDAVELVSFSTRPGLFFDSSSVLHLLTTSSLRTAVHSYPAGNWAVSRFRPNVVIRPTEELHGYVEDAWVGHTADLGGVQVLVRKQTERCIVTTRAQGDIPRDKTILQTLAREHGSTLGVYAAVTGVGVIHVGDDVIISAAGAHG